MILGFKCRCRENTPNINEICIQLVLILFYVNNKKYILISSITLETPCIICKWCNIRNLSKNYFRLIIEVGRKYDSGVFLLKKFINTNYKTLFLYLFFKKKVCFKLK